MRSRTTISSNNRSLPHLWVLGAAVAAGGLLLAGSPARAGDFKDGFQDQLGRIAAFQVVRAGQVLLTARIDPYAHNHYRYDTRHDTWHRYRLAVHRDWRRARHHRRHRVHQRNAYGHRVIEHFHGRDEPCGYEVADTGRDRRGRIAYVTGRYGRHW